MATQRRIRLLVADDHEMVRRGVKTFVDGTEIKVLAEAATGRAAAQLTLTTEVDLALLDVRMPDGDGLTALGRIKRGKPHLPVLMFSAFENCASMVRAIGLGAAGFLLKDCSRDELVTAIRTAAGGHSAWRHDRPCSMSGVLSTSQPAGGLEVFLSDREGELLRQMAFGLSNAHIAAAMNISYETLEEHLPNIFRKLGVRSRTQAALWALRNDLV